MSTSGLDYEVAAFELRQPPTSEPERPQRRSAAAPDAGLFDARELVRLATLAASSHNTQPWKFRIETGSITILPDFTRRCPVADPEDSHLFKSLGCAAENLAHAATLQRLDPWVRMGPGSGSVVVELRKDKSVRPSDLASSIPLRQCTRTAYSGLPVAPDEIRQLQWSAVGQGGRIEVFTSERDKDSILQFVSDGNERQLRSDGFAGELAQWIRFSDSEALRTRDGLSSRVTGNGQAPRWLAARLLPHLVRLSAARVSAAEAAKVRSSSGVAVFVSNGNDAAAWVQAGRAFERFSLRAAALGIRVALINQPVEVPGIRDQFHSWLRLQSGETAHLVARFGFAPLAPFSLRRPVADVIVGPQQD